MREVGHRANVQVLMSANAPHPADLSMHDGPVGRTRETARREPQHAHEEIMFGRDIGTGQYRQNVDEISLQACLL